MLDAIFNTALIAPLEIAKWLFVLFFVASTIGVIVGVYWEGEKFDKTKQHRGWKLLLRSLAAETAFGVLIFLSDGWIAEIQRAEIERQNFEIVVLRKNSLPRSIDIQAFTKKLEGAQPAKVEILYVPDCNDCWWLSSWLADALNNAHWSAGKPTPVAPQDRNWVRAVHSLYAQSWGITVVVNSPDKITADPKLPFGALNWALTHELGGNFGIQGAIDVSMPDDLIRIVVAPKA